MSKIGIIAFFVLALLGIGFVFISEPIRSAEPMTPVQAAVQSGNTTPEQTATPVDTVMQKAANPTLRMDPIEKEQIKTGMKKRYLNMSASERIRRKEMIDRLLKKATEKNDAILIERFQMELDILNSL